jgi:hypothetical protein
MPLPGAGSAPFNRSERRSPRRWTVGACNRLGRLTVIKTLHSGEPLPINARPAVDTLASHRGGRRPWCHLRQASPRDFQEVQS